MNLSVQKRLASELLKCGIHRVRLDPAHGEEIARAITREDMRRLIDKGMVTKAQEKGTSRGRFRKVAEQKRKGRRKGPGKRRGTHNARLPKKERWMQKIRAQRKLLREMRDGGEIDRSLYRRLYSMAKGGVFRSKAHMRNYIANFKERTSE
jgi:large subunit ribosomal protein L19e